MAEATVTPSAGAPARSYSFALRRLHSLLGIIPIGAFLVMHLGTNMLIAFSSTEADLFQQQVNRIHALGPFLMTVEVLFIFLPLAFHAGLGVKIWLESRPNASNYPYWANWRFTLQRITGVIALIFILVHVWHMHWMGEPFGGAKFDPDQASATAAYALQSDKLWAGPLYMLGVVASVFHFANGIWTALITWGITVGREAQRKAGYVCAVIGVLVAASGLIAIRGFMTYPGAQPRQSPTRMPDGASAAEGADQTPAATPAGHP